VSSGGRSQRCNDKHEQESGKDPSALRSNERAGGVPRILKVERVFGLDEQRAIEAIQVILRYQTRTPDVLKAERVNAFSQSARR
jgi:hypothetical protein